MHRSLELPADLDALASGPVMQGLVAIAFAGVLVTVIILSVRGYRAQRDADRRGEGRDPDDRGPR